MNVDVKQNEAEQIVILDPLIIKKGKNLLFCNIPMISAHIPTIKKFFEQRGCILTENEEYITISRGWSLLFSKFIFSAKELNDFAAEELANLGQEQEEEENKSFSFHPGLNFLFKKAQPAATTNQTAEQDDILLNEGAKVMLCTVGALMLAKKFLVR